MLTAAVGVAAPGHADCRRYLQGEPAQPYSECGSREGALLADVPFRAHQRSEEESQYRTVKNRSVRIWSEGRKH